MRRWLQLTRAHTAPLEVIPAVLGALLATGGRMTEAVMLWGVFGLLYHLTGYGHNSISDYRSGHDKNDPHKEHHPLNRNGIQFVVGSIIFISIMFIITILYTLYLVIPSTEGIALIGVMVFFGVAYNVYGKETHWKFVLIAIAHSITFALPYVSLGGDILDPVFILCWLYVFLWVVFQIAISGEMKDISTDESNLLLDLGMESDRRESDGRVHLTIPRKILYIGLAIRSQMIAAAFVVGLITNSIGAIMAIFVIWLSMFPTSDLLYEGTYNRDYRLKQMAIIEITSLVAFCFLLSFTTGLILALVLISWSAIWLLAFNRVEWGTYISPKV